MRNRIPRNVLAGLRSMPLFSECTNRQLRRLATLGTQVRVEAGQEVTVTEAPGAEWFVVLSGKAICRVRGSEVASFGPGDFFGELSLIDGSARSASVVAETPMQLLDLNRAEFACLLEVAPSVARKMLTAMAARMRATDAAIARAA
ncbi:MAG: cyclic nucleotide-binding domain-containing protein [Acidimicrobiales bacterium]